MVLLKNEGNLLPLKAAPRRIAVIGPNADSFDSLVGNYYGTPGDPVTVLDGLRGALPGQPDRLCPGYRADRPARTRCRCVGPVHRCGLHTHGPDYGTFRQHGLDGTPPSTVGRGDALCPVAQRRARKLGSLDRLHQGARNRHLQFRFAAENGYRVFVDGKPVVEEWGVGDAPSILVGHDRCSRRARPTRSASRRGSAASGASSSLSGAARATLAPCGRRCEERRPGDLRRRAVGPDRRRGDEGQGRRLLRRRPHQVALPKPQEDLLQQVVAAGKPTVLVLMNGSALAVNWADEHVPAIVEAWYPGGEGGHAVAH